MEDVVPGFNKYQNSIFEKLMEPLNEYALCALKIKQLKKRRGSPDSISRAFDTMTAAKNRINEILSQEQSEI